MKIIDLLNKIANGEIELEARFNWHYKCYDIELIFTERCGALGLYFQQEDRLIGLFERFNYQILNDEVEILKEEKKIPEKLDLAWQNAFDEQAQQDCIKMILENINTILDYLKSKGDE